MISLRLISFCLCLVGCLALPAIADESGGDGTHSMSSQGGGSSHSSHGHGNKYDLSHNNAGDGLNKPEEFKSDLAIWTFVVFVLLLVLVSKFAWRPILTGLEQREQGIAAKIEEARRSAEKAAEQLAIYEKKLAAAAEEAREIVAEAHRKAEANAERIRSEAEADAEKQRERALADIESAKNAAISELAERTVDIAVSLAGRMVSKEIKQKDHTRLIQEALDKFPSVN